MPEASDTPRRPIETGVPDPFPYMHPLLKKNYGEWDWHDRPRPGVLHHVAKGGDEVWTVRAGTQRQMDVYTIRLLCDIADEFAEGHVRFTTRSNIEFMLSSEAMVDPLIEKLNEEGFPVVGLRFGQLVGVVDAVVIKEDTNDVVPLLDRNLVKLWGELAAEHNIDLVVCVAAALRRGIKDEILAEGYRISGLGQLIELGMAAERTVVFGD